MTRSNLYTLTGDSGTTSLVGGTRVPKDSLRLEAYGTIDELNSQIGMLLACPSVKDATRRALTFVQHKLFNIGAYLATEPAPAEPRGLTPADVEKIERAIDSLDEKVPPQRTFILPGGATSAALAHVCRTVCRRAERIIVALGHEAEISPVVLAFVNRLSDLLFIIARHQNHILGIEETAWDQNA